MAYKTCGERRGVEGSGVKAIRWLHTLAYLALFCSLTSCDSKINPESAMNTPLPPGVDKNTPYGQWWTDKPALFNMSDQLKLAVPPQYQRFWLQRDEVTRAPADITKLPMHALNSGAALEFNFFLPDFSGFTPQNYEDEFHQDKVYVLIEAVGMGPEKPGAPGAFPPNMFQRTFYAGSFYSQDDVDLLHGLKCYRTNSTVQYGHYVCYGFEQNTMEPSIKLTLPFPPYPSFMVNPLIESRYFSTAHGGVVLLWRTHVKNFARWKEIDQKIWEFLAEWNVIKTSPAKLSPALPQQKP
jgi:hypothetical protein